MSQDGALLYAIGETTAPDAIIAIYIQSGATPRNTSKEMMNAKKPAARAVNIAPALSLVQCDAREGAGRSPGRNFDAKTSFIAIM